MTMKRMAAFDGVAPTYHIELRECPALIWNFNSLLLCIQMMFSFMLTDDDFSLKVCKHCDKAFTATRSNMEFCSPQCKNQYNVHKSRPHLLCKNLIRLELFYRLFLLVAVQSWLTIKEIYFCGFLISFF